MNLRDSLNRLYYNMTIYDVRYVNRSITGNLSYNSIMYLDIIAYQDNCTVSSIAETLGISKPAVTKKVNELIRLGHVVKTQSGKDKRVSDELQKNSVVYDRPFERALRTIEKKYSPEQLAVLGDIMDIYSQEIMKEDGEQWNTKCFLLFHR